MTDRTRLLTVMLDDEYRVDDVEAIVHAIRMTKGVAKVEINVANASDWLAYSRARSELEKRLWDALKDKP